MRRVWDRDTNEFKSHEIDCAVDALGQECAVRGAQITMNLKVIFMQLSSAPYVEQIINNEFKSNIHAAE